MEDNGRNRYTKPITQNTKIIIRGAKEHFKQPAYKNIRYYARQNRVGLIVLATPHASTGLSSRLKQFKQNGDANLLNSYCFGGDWNSFWHSITGTATPTTTQRNIGIRRCLKVWIRMRRVIQNNKRVLVLCQVGRNRSFALSFGYYLLYHGRGKTYTQAYHAFKKWSGVSFDNGLQDQNSRLYSTRSSWAHGLQSIFEIPPGKKFTRKRQTELFSYY